MKSNAKSSITLPPAEVKLVRDLKKKLKAKSNVEVVRRGLNLLKEQTDRDLLRRAYESASHQVADALRDELDELDHLAGEGLD
jgi:Arc/MetJ-type ribon-helix-helix transcriptional regulator